MFFKLTWTNDPRELVSGFRLNPSGNKPDTSSSVGMLDKRSLPKPPKLFFFDELSSTDAVVVDVVNVVELVVVDVLSSTCFTLGTKCDAIPGVLSEAENSLLLDAVGFSVFPSPSVSSGSSLLFLLNLDVNRLFPDLFRLKLDRSSSTGSVACSVAGSCSVWSSWPTFSPLRCLN